jgi:hypothetical protein
MFDVLPRRTTRSSESLPGPGLGVALTGLLLWGLVVAVPSVYLPLEETTERGARWASAAAAIPLLVLAIGAWRRRAGWLLLGVPLALLGAVAAVPAWGGTRIYGAVPFALVCVAAALYFVTALRSARARSVVPSVAWSPGAALAAVYAAALLGLVVHSALFSEPILALTLQHHGEAAGRIQVLSLGVGLFIWVLVVYRMGMSAAEQMARGRGAVAAWALAPHPLAPGARALRRNLAWSLVGAVALLIALWFDWQSLGGPTP